MHRQQGCTGSLAQIGHILYKFIAEHVYSGVHVVRSNYLSAISSCLSRPVEASTCSSSQAALAVWHIS